LEHRPLKGGMYNTTYFVKTDNGDIVVRVGPVNTHLLFPHGKDSMATEPLFHTMLKDNGIPTSVILKYSPAGTVLDRPYIISEYIESVTMSDKSLSGVNLDNIYEEVGGYARKMHEITNDRFGRKRPDGSREFNKWSEFMLDYADTNIKKAREYELFPDADLDAFWQYLNDGETVRLLDEITVPRMVHADLWPGNVLLRKNGDKYQVAAIIDLEHIIFGDIYWEFRTPWMIKEPFIKGYGREIAKTPEIAKRGDIYSAIPGISAVYILTHVYDMAQAGESVKGNTLKTIRKILEIN